ncbi:unnamed protein product [Pipistrellus nathusii]|uniref:Peptidase S1 domain-containing protein n=1 Tax=Pipistrellus nathusii TaxID=59473 RepID=A0ABP0A3V9_PIPNA
MATPPSCPGAGPGASSKALGLLLFLLLLLPSRHLDSEGITLSQAVACGRRHVQGRILGGTDAPEGKWPWQVSVHYGGFHICGGSIINEYWILTAAHCFSKNRSPAAFDMYVGLVDLKLAGNHTQWFEVNKVIIHHTFEMYHPLGGDVALVQLKSPIVFSDSVLPICIATPNINLENLTCWVTGWGLISQTGDTSDHLQELQMSLIPFVLCQMLYGHTSYIVPDMICAGVPGELKTACEGDSGGPLVCESNHTWVQIGIVSWSRGCLFPMYPTVFARVSHFSIWIHHQIALTPVPPQPLPTFSSSLGPSVHVLMTMMTFLTML